MLATPNGHKKVIVLFNGWRPNLLLYSESSSNRGGWSLFTGHNLRIDKINQVALLISLVAIMRQIKNNINKRINSTFIATIGEAMALKQRGIEIHGLGIQLQKRSTS